MDEEDIFPIPPSHAYAISIVIWEKYITHFFAVGSIDQYTPSSRGGELTNIPPLDNSKILLIGVLTNIPPLPKGGIDQYTPLRGFYYCLGGCTLENIQLSRTL